MSKRISARRIRPGDVTRLEDEASRLQLYISAESGMSLTLSAFFASDGTVYASFQSYHDMLLHDEVPMWRKTE